MNEILNNKLGIHAINFIAISEKTIKQLDQNEMFYSYRTIWYAGPESGNFSRECCKVTPREPVGTGGNICLFLPDEMVITVMAKEKT